MPLVVVYLNEALKVLRVLREFSFVGWLDKKLSCCTVLSRRLKKRQKKN